MMKRTRRWHFPLNKAERFIGSPPDHDYTGNAYQRTVNTLQAHLINAIRRSTDIETHIAESTRERHWCHHPITPDSLRYRNVLGSRNYYAHHVGRGYREGG